MILGSLGPVEWGAIIAGVLLIAGFIYWRIRMGRVPKQDEEKLDTAP